MAMTKEQIARLEALRVEQAGAWQEADRERENLAELEALEYEAALRALVADLEQKHGKRGHSWDCILTNAGPVAVKIGEAVCYAKLLDSLNNENGLQLADMQEFIMPNLANMSREDYITKCTAHPGMPVMIWPVLARLYRGEKDRAAGK